MGCQGFEEDVVFGVKNCFYDYDIKKIIILPASNLTNVFHHRECSITSVDEEKGISEACILWFESIVTCKVEESNASEVDIKEDVEEVQYDIAVNFHESLPEKSEMTFSRSNEESLKPKEESQLSCEYCDKKFRLKGTLQKHLQRKHKLQMAQKRSHVKGNFYCEECGLGYDNKRSLYKHVKRKHGNSSKENEEKAVVKKEKEGKQTTKSAEKFIEKVCDKNQNDIERSKKKDKYYMCEHCAETIKGYSTYQFHLSGHTGERKFKCSICNKQFRTSSDKYNCERGHRDIYKWRCADCPFKTHQKNKYIRHLRTHTKSQPFSCPICNTKTSRKDYLKRHLLKNHCTATLTLSDVENMYPNVYDIEEDISVQSAIKYSQSDLSAPVNMEDTKYYNDLKNS
eukprot:TRINITY_DN2524_c0_g1_i1.p1 TRINITY_DN2524_c0_g1~~TRINITY_DN2524_c0_g1_i1.p1  ORF type:complete len:398 (-),score=47.67 TRINITY_DN2524_c0_g1_i1:160-1353(-)